MYKFFDEIILLRNIHEATKYHNTTKVNRRRASTHTTFSLIKSSVQPTYTHMSLARLESSCARAYTHTHTRYSKVRARAVHAEFCATAHRAERQVRKARVVASLPGLAQFVAATCALRCCGHAILIKIRERALSLRGIFSPCSLERACRMYLPAIAFITRRAELELARVFEAHPVAAPARSSKADNSCNGTAQQLRLSSFAPRLLRCCC